MGLIVCLLFIVFNFRLLLCEYNHNSTIWNSNSRVKIFFERYLYTKWEFQVIQNLLPYSQILNFIGFCQYRN